MAEQDFQMEPEVGSRSCLIKVVFVTSCQIHGIHGCLIDYPIDSLLNQEPIFPSFLNFFIFMMKWLFLHHCTQLLEGFLLHSLTERLIDCVRLIPNILIPCSQQSIYLESFPERCINKILFYQSKFQCFLFSCFFLCLQSQKANCLGMVSSLHLEGLQACMQSWEQRLMEELHKCSSFSDQCAFPQEGWRAFISLQLFQQHGSI